ncbi:hypothetical protein O181_035575 [Austropuccinia psidii MF-1]|uniref:Uncharacterized protein n=1 Tax=Austropuccinia psidii MF-1 TaxID=1389203 RepID=A0A9Q3D750_9BASI|nr:hypothetical protein [Austropuccinia psidii MF-1]
MSCSTCSRKAANDNAKPKPLSSKEVYSLLNSLRSEVSSLKAARISDTAKMQLLQLALSFPPHYLPLLSASMYNRFIQEPYWAADRSSHLHHNGSNFADCSPQENRAISHFIDSMLPPDFSLCIGVVPAHTTAKEFFDVIKERCCPGKRFQKLEVARDMLDLLVENGAGKPKLNSTIILSLHKSFVIFKKLGIDTDELEGLLAQAAYHAPASLDQVAFDQLVMSAILAKGDEKPLSTFVGQVILNTSRRDSKHSQSLLPFIYHMSGSQDHPLLHSRPCSPYFAKPVASTSNVRRPPEHLVDKFGGTPDCYLQALSSPHYQREWVSQVKFVEHDATDCILIDTGGAIHLSGSARFATNLKDVTPFCIFFANLNSLVTISQTGTLKIPVKNGSILFEDIPFSTKISGTILSVGVTAMETGRALPLITNGKSSNT